MFIKESLYKVPFSHLRVLDRKTIVHVDSSYHRWIHITLIAFLKFETY